LDEAKRSLRAGEASTAPPDSDPVSQSNLRELVEGLVQTVNEMARLLTKLQEDILRHGEELDRSREEIRYIVEENAALQELVARLVERIDALEAPAAPSAPGRRAPEPHESIEQASHGRILLSSACADPSASILSWQPEDLGSTDARLQIAGLRISHRLNRPTSPVTPLCRRSAAPRPAPSTGMP